MTGAPDDEPVHRPPLEDSLDLHTFAPRDAADLVAEYLAAAREAGLREVRIIHGKGTGRLRETVHAVLRRDPHVAGFVLAPQSRGGWGATVVTLGDRPAESAGDAADASAEPGTLQRWTRGAIRLYERWSPPLSLAAGGFTVWQMRTHFDELRWALLALLAGVALWILERWLTRPIPLAQVVAQSSFQSAVWFLVPFYLVSAAPVVAHAAVIALLLAVAILWTWDPWFLRADAHPVARVGLRSVVLFYALVAVLPTLFGISLGLSWWLAAILSGMSVLLAGFGKLTRAGRWTVAAAVFLAAWFAEPWFPAVPLRVTELRWEPALAESMESLPPSLALHTAVAAPLGLQDELEHVFFLDGVEIDRIPLRITGGREAGFRTWSRKRNFPDDPRGAWRVEVRTSDGRLLDVARFGVTGGAR